MYPCQASTATRLRLVLMLDGQKRKSVYVTSRSPYLFLLLLADRLVSILIVYSLSLSLCLTLCLSRSVSLSLSLFLSLSLSLSVSRYIHLQRKYINEIDPEIRVEAKNEMFTKDKAEALLHYVEEEEEGEQVNGRHSTQSSFKKTPTFVVDAIDDLETKADLIAYCLNHRIRIISSMGAAAKVDARYTNCLCGKLCPLDDYFYYENCDDDYYDENCDDDYDAL